jgi:hypothetical protein
VKIPRNDHLTNQLQSRSDQVMKNGIRRRSFLKGLGVTAAALLPGSALLVSNAQAQSGTFH